MYSSAVGVEGADSVYKEDGAGNARGLYCILPTTQPQFTTCDFVEELVQAQHMTKPFDLFPPPSTPVSQLPNLRSVLEHPKGQTEASTTSLLEILKDNHARWHIFFNDASFHNHTAHTVLALWSLGASEKLLKASYDITQQYQRPISDSPHEITTENWKDHLGDSGFYKAYLTFFTAELERLGAHRLLEVYIFSVEANFPENPVQGSAVSNEINGTTGLKDEKGCGAPVEMLNRFLDSIMHPLIHAGYGLEFNIPVMLVEGVAQAMLHKPSSSILIPRELFFPLSATRDESSSQSVSLNGTTGGPHALSILARLMKDPSFNGFRPSSDMKMYAETMKKFGAQIKTYGDAWLGSTPRPLSDVEAEEKAKELILLVTFIYGVLGAGGLYRDGLKAEERDRKKYNADFFFAHFVTSAYFIPTFLAHLPSDTGSHARYLLLRSYLSVILGWYVGRGRPTTSPAHIKAFFSDASGLTPSKRFEGSRSPWEAVLKSAMYHPDEHVPKLQRTLKYFDGILGGLEKEKGALKDTELEGAEYVDGTIFLRTALLSAERFGWLGEGEGLNAPRSKAAITVNGGAAENFNNDGTWKGENGQANGEPDIENLQEKMARLLLTFPWDRKGFYESA
ncbi:hypothetical protein CC1G_07985 [Coprinopsis cinerea okayama7|uniref:Uncharacterized protein n=1 Tax=Coprinopsis cinerea (strain Okayama-7 / 130 / ATCC MYA-4618 / FGSC 9003) TaxID=240176 RepID=A8P249_COPC7|nr:hypothetical protein CC1G_07985 [Coprinopsis cinerea okayama7\|eukprot:XP_001838244.2 hypothetical protein CC1G_07985 [Coprinopsis cinerea okayama7\